MAKRMFRVVIVDRLENLSMVYLVIDKDLVSELEQISGVMEVGEEFSGKKHQVLIDPRYDFNQVCEEIEELNNDVPIPDAFLSA